MEESELVGVRDEIVDDSMDHVEAARLARDLQRTAQVFFEKASFAIFLFRRFSGNYVVFFFEIKFGIYIHLVRSNCVGFR